LPSDNPKLQIGRVRESVILRVRLSLRNHFLPLVKKKNDMGAVEKEMFQGVAWL
jgi:hypothetical protein